MRKCLRSGTMTAAHIYGVSFQWAGTSRESTAVNSAILTIYGYLLSMFIGLNSRHGDYKQTLGRARGRIFRPVVLNK